MIYPWGLFWFYKSYTRGSISVLVLNHRSATSYIKVIFITDERCFFIIMENDEENTNDENCFSNPHPGICSRNVLFHWAWVPGTLDGKTGCITSVRTTQSMMTIARNIREQSWIFIDFNNSLTTKRRFRISCFLHISRLQPLKQHFPGPIWPAINRDRDLLSCLATGPLLHNFYMHPH